MLASVDCDPDLLIRRTRICPPRLVLPADLPTVGGPRPAVSGARLGSNWGQPGLDIRMAVHVRQVNARIIPKIRIITPARMARTPPSRKRTNPVESRGSEPIPTAPRPMATQPKTIKNHHGADPDVAAA
jgi:hypothetical protein